MVNPLAPTVSPVAETGVEGSAIALNLGVTVNGLTGDGNTLRSLVVSAIPIAAVLADGAGGHISTASAGNTSVDVKTWTLSSLKITPPTEFEVNFTLTITATERDAENNLSTVTTVPDLITVTGVADTPVLGTAANRTLNENNSVGLTGLSVASADPLSSDASDTYNVALSVGHGSLVLGTSAGLTVTADGAMRAHYRNRRWNPILSYKRCAPRLCWHAGAGWEP
jgi:hypothetical protein